MVRNSGCDEAIDLQSRMCEPHQKGIIAETAQELKHMLLHTYVRITDAAGVVGPNDLKIGPQSTPEVVDEAIALKKTRRS